MKIRRGCSAIMDTRSNKCGRIATKYYISYIKKVRHVVHPRCPSHYFDEDSVFLHILTPDEYIAYLVLES